MNEELLELMKQMEQGENIVGTATAPTVSVTEEQEQELTPDIKQKVPVVNNARKPNRLSGITNFLGNPETQMALITLGQAISNTGNYTGQPNPVDVIGDFGKQNIQNNAERRALEAFERGEPIAEAAGQFARPEFIAGLQARSEERSAMAARLGLSQQEFDQRKEEFEQTINLEGRAQEFRENNAKDDILLRRAVQKADVEQFESMFDLRKRQTTAEENVSSARADLMRAQIEHLGDDSQNIIDLTAQTNRYLESLNEHIGILQQRRNNIQRELEGEQAPARQSVFSLFNPARPGAGALPGQRGTIPASSEWEALNEELKKVNQSIEVAESDRDLLQKVQAKNLGVETSEKPAGDGSEEETTGAPKPQGTVEQPVQVASLEQANELPTNSVFIDPLGSGRILRLNEDRTKTPVGRVGEEQ